MTRHGSTPGKRNDTDRTAAADACSSSSGNESFDVSDGLEGDAHAPQPLSPSSSCPESRPSCDGADDAAAAAAAAAAEEGGDAQRPVLERCADPGCCGLANTRVGRHFTHRRGRCFSRRDRSLHRDLLWNYLYSRRDHLLFTLVVMLVITGIAMAAFLVKLLRDPLGGAGTMIYFTNIAFLAHIVFDVNIDVTLAWLVVLLYHAHRRRDALSQRHDASGWGRPLAPETIGEVHSLDDLSTLRRRSVLGVIMSLALSRVARSVVAALVTQIQSLSVYGESEVFQQLADPCRQSRVHNPAAYDVYGRSVERLAWWLSCIMDYLPALWAISLFVEIVILTILVQNSNVVDQIAVEHGGTLTIGQIIGGDAFFHVGPILKYFLLLVLMSETTAFTGCIGATTARSWLLLGEQFVLVAAIMITYFRFVDAQRLYSMPHGMTFGTLFLIVLAIFLLIILPLHCMLRRAAERTVRQHQIDESTLRDKLATAIVLASARVTDAVCGQASAATTAASAAAAAAAASSCAPAPGPGPATFTSVVPVPSHHHHAHAHTPSAGAVPRPPSALRQPIAVHEAAPQRAHLVQPQPQIQPQPQPPPPQPPPLSHSLSLQPPPPPPPILSSYQAASASAAAYCPAPQRVALSSPGYQQQQTHLFPGGSVGAPALSSGRQSSALRFVVLDNSSATLKPYGSRHTPVEARAGP
jgi:hypothetical protein